MSQGKEKGIGFDRGGLSPGPAGKNHLLVIAIDEYVHCPKLNNCVKDATDFVEVLKAQYEFDPQNTLTLYNQEATRANIHAKLKELRKKVKAQDNLVIFFSGHGEVDGEVGYWVPVEADPEKDWEFIETSALKNRLNAINSFHTFLIVDACFSGSLFATYRSVKAGYETKRSRLGLAASHSRERALDGTPGENSPFAEKLLKRLRDNDGSLSAQKLATDVIEEVQAATRGKQTPVFKHLDVRGDDSGQFVFHPKANEVADWATCQKVGTLQVFQAYLKKYPEGKHREEAEQQIAFLKEESAWQQARKENRIEGYLKYRREYKEGRYREQALEAIKELEEDQAWQLACGRNTIFGYEQYLDKYPKGKYRKDAEAGMDMLLNRQSDKREREEEDQKWEDARSADTPKAYKEYLQAYPGGKYSAQAKSRITELEALALEARREGEIKAAWEQVKDSRSIAALEGFRRKYPDHRYAASAARLIDQLKTEAASKQTTISETKPPGGQIPDTSKKPPPAEQETSSLKKYWPWLAGVAVLAALIIGWAIGGSGGQPDDPASKEDLTALDDDTLGMAEETLAGAPSQYKEQDPAEPPTSTPDPVKEQPTPPAISRSFSGDVLTVTVREGTPPYELKLLRRGNEVYQQSLNQAGAHRITITEYRQDAGTYSINVTDGNGQTAERSIRIDLPKVVKLPSPSVKVGTATLGGQRYSTIQFNSGNLTWMTQNLNVDVPDSWCYDNDPANCAKYGRLYTWEAAKRACASLGQGWRLPTDEEWRDLAKRFGGADDDASDGGKAAYQAMIEGGNSGFNARLGGYRTSAGSFVTLGDGGYYWSATERHSGSAWLYNFYRNSGKLLRYDYLKSYGRSCRCVQD